MRSAVAFGFGPRVPKRGSFGGPFGLGPRLAMALAPLPPPALARSADPRPARRNMQVVALERMSVLAVRLSGVSVGF